MTHPFLNFIIQNIIASRKIGTSSPGRGSNTLNFEKENTKLFATSDSSNVYKVNKKFFEINIFALAGVLQKGVRRCCVLCVDKVGRQETNSKNYR